MATYEGSRSLSLNAIRRSVSVAEDVSDSFIPETVEGLSLYGKRMHLTLYYQQKKHVYIYYLMWCVSCGFGGHLFYTNRPKDGFRRLLVPLYFTLLVLVLRWVGIPMMMMGDFMADAWSVIRVITLLGFIIWWLSIFVFELINASDIVRSANINISKGLSERVGALDEIKKTWKYSSLRKSAPCSWLVTAVQRLYLQRYLGKSLSTFSQSQWSMMMWSQRNRVKKHPHLIVSTLLHQPQQSPVLLLPPDWIQKGLMADASLLRDNTPTK